jgi:hypothetical protein
MKKSEEKKEVKREKLPRYLMLAKGSMWFDTEGENCSGTRLFSISKVLIGRAPGDKDTPIDEYNNDNIVDYGKVDSKLDWYVDTSKIPTEKLSRLILAYNNNILIEADPNKPPKFKELSIKKNFKIDKKGDIVFVGKNEEIYKKLQNLDFNNLRNFINTTPKTSLGKQNLTDLLNYEQKGYNPVGRSRFEVLELIKSKVREFGNFMTPMSKNSLE